MDAAMRVLLGGLLWTVIAPVGAAGLFLAVGYRFGARGAAVAGAAVLAGLLVGAFGAGGLPSGSPGADEWLTVGALLAGALGLGLDSGYAASTRPSGVAATGALVLAVIGWQVVASLAGVFDDGIGGALAELWAVDAFVVGFAVWLALHHGLGEGPGGQRATPIVLGSLAVALAGAAVCTAVSGSARIGQQLGAAAVVVGVVGLVGWRLPSLRAGHGAVGAAAALLVLGLVYVHHFVEVPRPVAQLLLLAPLAALAGDAVGRRSGRTLPAVVATLLLSLSAVGVAAALTLAHEASEESPTSDEGGTYLPY